MTKTTGSARWDELSDNAESARVAFETRSDAYWLVVHDAAERARRGPRWWTEKKWAKKAGLK